MPPKFSTKPLTPAQVKMLVGLLEGKTVVVGLWATFQGSEPVSSLTVRKLANRGLVERVKVPIKQLKVGSAQSVWQLTEAGKAEAERLGRAASRKG